MPAACWVQRSAKKARIAAFTTRAMRTSSPGRLLSWLASMGPRIGERPARERSGAVRQRRPADPAGRRLGDPDPMAGAAAGLVLLAGSDHDGGPVERRRLAGHEALRHGRGHAALV